MIRGNVNADREAVVRLPLRGPDDREQEIEAVIDTGFNGFLTLPPSMVATLDLPLIGRGRAILADGSEALLNVYEVTAVWDGQIRVIETDEVDAEALIGMSLLYGYHLQIQAVDGGAVTIEALP